MSNINKHIDDFLDYYYDFNLPPEYAVLIKGPWGTGKSWFVQRTLERLKEKKGKFLYVSLYGVTSFDEIEDSFFQQLHPVLSSKGMKLTSKIVKGFLKATIKVDLDGDGKSDGSVGAQAPDINIPDYLKDTDAFVLVFDDLERCSMNVCDILGYINHFVEHQGYKVVIVANEDEIVKKDDTEKTYLRIKEKLIGKTLEIKPDVEAALHHFIERTEKVNVKLFFNRCFEKLIHIYNDSEYKNLRHLKQSLWDFERLYKKLEQPAKDKEELLDHLLKLYLAYSFEIKGGNLQPNEIKRIKGSMFSGLLGNSDIKKEKSLYSTLSTKYPMVQFSEPIFDEGIWEEILDKGLIDAKKISESLKNSKYFSTENTPAWIKLWHFHDLTDNDFDVFVKQVKDDLENHRYNDVNVVKHVAGILFNLSDIELIKDTKKEVLEQCCIYIDYLKENSEIPFNIDKERSFFDNDHWGGLGFSGKEIQEFKEFCQHLESVIEGARINSFPDTADDLLQTLKSDSQLFLLKLILSNSKENVFYKIPILQHTEPSTFVDIYLELKPEDAKNVGYMFKERYRVQQFNSSLRDELDWLKKVKVLLVEKEQQLRGKLSGYRIGLIVNNYLDEAILNLSVESENG